jgi:hypothetical protein
VFSRVCLAATLFACFSQIYSDSTTSNYFYNQLLTLTFRIVALIRQFLQLSEVWQENGLPEWLEEADGRQAPGAK